MKTNSIQFQITIIPVHPDWFMESIRSILNTPLKAPSKSPVKFKSTPEAIQFNTDLLASFDYDVSKLIAAYPNSELGYGSEFRPAEVLEPLFYKHHNWARMKDFLTNGFAPKFKPIADDQWLADNINAINKGNHKSALDHLDVLRDQVEAEIKLGYQFPFDISIINKIVGVVVAPYGVAV